MGFEAPSSYPSKLSQLSVDTPQGKTQRSETHDTGLLIQVQVANSRLAWNWFSRWSSGARLVEIGGLGADGINSSARAIRITARPLVCSSSQVSEAVQQVRDHQPVADLCRSTVPAGRSQVLPVCCPERRLGTTPAQRGEPAGPVTTEHVGWR